MTSRLKNHPEYLFLFLIVLVGTLLRFCHLGEISLSNDELSALLRTRFDNLPELLQKGVAVDGHPAGVQVFLYYWIKLFGISEFALRFPFAIAGILSIVLSYFVADKWFGKFTGLSVAAGIAFLQFPLLYSQIERPYASGLLLTIAAVLFWSRILFEKKTTWWNYGGLIIFFSLSMYNHYFSFLFVAIAGVTGLFFLSKENFKGYLLSGLLTILLFVPHLSITQTHLQQSGLDWLPAPGNDFLGNFIYYIFNESAWVYYSFWFIVIWTFWKSRKTVEWSAFHTICLVFFLAPFLIGYFKSVYGKPVLQYSTLIFSVPYLLIFGFSFLESISKRTKILVVIAFSGLCLSSTLIEKKYYQTYHFGVFKELAASTMEWVIKYGQENVEKTINVNNPYYIHYYLDRYDKEIAFSIYNCTSPEGIRELSGLLEKSDKPYFIHGGWEDNLGHHLILEKYPVIVEERDYDFSRIILYSKEDTVSAVRWPYDYEKEDTTGYWENWQNRVGIFTHSGNYAMAIQDQSQYSASFKIPLGEIAKHGNQIVCSAWISVSDPENYANAVISIESPEGQGRQWMGRSVRTYIKIPNRWTKVFMNFTLPESYDEQDILKFYIWNPGYSLIFVDDMEVRIKESSVKISEE